MPLPNNKWANFRANTSTLDVNPSDIRPGNWHEDWRRDGHSKKNPIYINGILVSDIAKNYSNFETPEDVENFFNVEILQSFTGTPEQRAAAVNFLKNTLHQGGYLHPVCTAVYFSTRFLAPTTDVDLQTGEIFGEREGRLFITTTSNGFQLQDFYVLKCLQPTSPEIEEFTHQFGTPAKKDSDTLIIKPQDGQESLLEAEATFAFDFSKDSAHPSVTLTSSHLNVVHEGLKPYYDKRNLIQILLDFLRSLVGFDKVQDLSTSTPAVRSVAKPVPSQTTDDDALSVDSDPASASTQSISEADGHGSDSDIAGRLTLTPDSMQRFTSSPGS